MESRNPSPREDEIRLRFARMVDEAIKTQGGDPRTLREWTLGRIDHGRWVLSALRGLGFSLGAGTSILDIGSGLGGDVLAFAMEGLETVTVEYRHIEDLAEIASEYGLPLRVVHADGTRLPFRSGSFDITAAFQVIEHIRDPRVLVGEMARVTKPGGAVLFTTPLRPWLTRFLPDPHYGIWGLALFDPEKQKQIVEERGLGPYEWTGLFGSVAELRTLCEAAGLDLNVYAETGGGGWLLPVLRLLFGKETGTALLPGREVLLWARKR